MSGRPAAPLLDPTVRRAAAGRLLVGGSPGRLVRLSAGGAAALDRVLAGAPLAGDAALAERLLARGLLHPVASVPAEVTFVIPVRDGGDPLARLVGRLLEWGEVIVVDDGSTDASAARAAAAGARVIASAGGTSGPGAARNAGLAASATEFVAFVDADCQCEDDWARPLAGLLAADPRLALAAPRVRSAPGPGAIARYERARSPLDMGAEPALVGPGGRVAYVPSAALVARREALVELGGFAAELRFGEDVDLVWRALAAGWSVRYAPEVEVEHLPRPSLAAFARQRRQYGGSAARLEQRHPGLVAPLRLDRGTVTVGIGALAAGRRGVALAALGQVLWAGSRQRDRTAALLVSRLAARGLLRSGGHLARAAARDWLPLTLAACALGRRSRRGAALLLLADALAGADRAPSLVSPRALLLRALDNGAYAAGLWSGALRQRSAKSLLPRFRG